MAGARLGAFELHDVLGRGSGGEVWRASHVASGIAVAVKVVGGAGRRALSDRFEDEVRAVARLDHPHIVGVFDYGEVDEAIARAALGQVLPGQRWLAMELAHAGPLAGRLGRLTWPRARQILLEVLDGLGHLHARGLVHRDVKPGNVLLESSGDLRPGAKLADFGLARQADEGDEDYVVGTPRYMAPEQVRGARADYGPWTDLYALGHLAWAMASGRPAFPDRDPRAAMRAQLQAVPPPLQPMVSVPAGFEAWCRRLLAKEPLDRFERAADVARALRALEAAVAGRPAAGPPRGGSEDRSEPSTERPPTDASAAATAMFTPAPTERIGEALPRTRPVPPMPRTWASPPRSRSPSMLGVGLGLFGLRALRLVGRRAERDRLWDALRLAHTHRRPQAVVLSGAAGTGKSRLATWLVRRAHEVGVGEPVVAVHGPAAGPAYGLAPMLDAALQTTGLDRAGVEAQLRHLVRAGRLPTELPLAAVARLVRPEPDVEPEPEPARHRLVLQVLRGLAGPRTLIWVVDDAQWAPEALRLAVRALTDGPGRVLVVATVRREAVTPEVTPALAELVELPAVDRVLVEPLDPSERLDLVAGLLQLDEGLATEVVARAGGHPLFAVQLVGDWVRRGVLTVGPGGFALAPHADATIPDDLHALWASRLAPALERLPDDAVLALHAAAALGAAVDLREWGAVAGELGIAPTTLVSVASTLQREGLWLPGPGGLVPVHGLLHESVRRTASRSSAWPTIHRACATVLATKPAAIDRLPLHLVEGGQVDAAWTAMLDAAWVSQHVDRQRGLEWLDRAEALADGQGAPADAPRRGRALLLRAVLTLLGADHDAVMASLEPLLADDAPASWAPWRAAALRVRGGVSRDRGDLGAAIADLRASIERASSTADLDQVNRSRLVLGEVLMRSGDLDGAEAALHALRDTTDDDDINPRRMLSELLLSSIAMNRGDPEAQRRWLDLAAAKARRAGHRAPLANVAIMSGSLHYQAGAFEAAARSVGEALSIYRSMGYRQNEGYALLNLGYVKLGQERWVDAGVHFDETLAVASELDNAVIETLAAAGHLVVSAALGDVVRFDRGMDRVEALVARTGIAESILAENAADAAQRLRDPERAARARALAARQYRALGRDADADALATP